MVHKVKDFLKEHPIRVAFATFCVLLVAGTQLWERYAPFSIHSHNQEEIGRIRVKNTDRFSFVVLGDSAGNNSDFESLLRAIDHDMEASFVIDIGDLVQRGRKGLYRRFLNQVKESITIPFLTAIGNYDLKGGSDQYQEVFGPAHYSFRVGQSCFIFLDIFEEGRFDRAERQWLEEELKKSQSLKTLLVFMHILPFDPRGEAFNNSFTEKDRKDLLALLNRYRVTHLFASHIPGYFSGVWEGIPYTITGSGGVRSQGSDPNHLSHYYVKVYVDGEMVDTVIKPVDSQETIRHFFDVVRGWGLDWGPFFGMVISLILVALSLRNRCCLHK